MLDHHCWDKNYIFFKCLFFSHTSQLQFNAALYPTHYFMQSFLIVNCSLALEYGFHFGASINLTQIPVKRQFRIIYNAEGIDEM